MNNNDYIIRLEKKIDYRETENLVRESFWNVYRPGCSEHYVIHEVMKKAEQKVEKETFYPLFKTLNLFVQGSSP